MKHISFGLHASIVAAALCAFTLPSPASATVSAGTCESVTRSVSLGSGLPTNQSIKGLLCRPNVPSAGPTRIDILIHGATYNRDYWNFSTGGVAYSYVDRTLASGRATLSFDMIGAGQSSKPLSTSVNLTSAAWVLHQLVGYVRSQGFSIVNLVGHSLGSTTAIQEAALYNDVDRVVVTSFLHQVGATAALLPLHLGPASLDPRFVFSLLDPGYLTTSIGSRRGLFYGPFNVELPIVLTDEANKDLVTASSMADFSAQLLAPPASNVAAGVRVPVLVIAGQQDALLCGLTLDCSNKAAVTAAEAPYYSHAASVSIETVQATGHDLTLHTTASASFATIDAWLKH
jgi:pimeloyl-ACP methyl ester carboxylesterase